MNDKQMLIAFIGFRGTGKTTVATLLGDKIGYQVFSTDRVIEMQEGKTIAEIVTQNGWEYFRNVESEILHSALHNKNTIIDCGGGIVLRELNRTLLKKNASLVIWMNAGVETIEQRIAGDANRIRFDSEKKLREEIIEELASREIFYQQLATHTFNSSKESAETIAEKIYLLIHQ